MQTDRGPFVRIWLTLMLIGATTHLALWCASYLAVVSTWKSVPAGYGLSNLVGHAPTLMLTWLYYAPAAALTGLVAAGTAPRLSRLSWLALSAGAGGVFSGLFTVLFTLSLAAVPQAALYGVVSAAVGALIVLAAGRRRIEATTIP